jgi:hypothetical protein
MHSAEPHLPRRLPSSSPGARQRGPRAGGRAGSPLWANGGVARDCRVPASGAQRVGEHSRHAILRQHNRNRYWVVELCYGGTYVMLWCPFYTPISAVSSWGWWLHATSASGRRAPATEHIGGDAVLMMAALNLVTGLVGQTCRHRRPLRNKALRNLASICVPFNSNLSTI